jgi:hypothetical protein
MLLLRTALALALIPAGFLFLWPLLARWLGARRANGASGFSPMPCLAFGLSLGALSLWMFGLALAGMLTPAPVLGLVGLGWAAGYVLNPGWFDLARLWAGVRAAWGAIARLDVPALAWLAVGGSLTVILVYDLYYPFVGEDTLSRYGLFAQRLYESHVLTPDVKGYPLLVPLAFVYTWHAAGAANEHLANLVPFAFALGSVGVSGLLAQEIRPLTAKNGRAIGALAAAITATTPMFVTSSTWGYADIPTGFYMGLSALFALRWARGGQHAGRDGLLAGVLAGLTVWTKQAGLTALASLVGVAALRAVRERRARPLWEGCGLFLAPAALIGGAWYARNYLMGGLASVVIVAGEYHLIVARPELAEIIPALAHPTDFGQVLMPVYAVGLALGAWRVVRQIWEALRGHDTTLADPVMALFAVPYWLAWWTRFSFDTRFLLVILPFYAAWAAWPLAWLEGRLAAADRRNLRGWVALPLLVGALALGTRERWGGMYYALTEPTTSDAEKLTRLKNDLYPTVEWVRANLDPSHDRLLLMDGRLAYYLRDYDVHVSYPRHFESVRDFDYLITTSSTTTIYTRLGWTESDYYRHRQDPEYFELLFDGGEGTRVYRVLPPARGGE